MQVTIKDTEAEAKRDADIRAAQEAYVTAYATAIEEDLSYTLIHEAAKTRDAKIDDAWKVYYAVISRPDTVTH